MNPAMRIVVINPDNVARFGLRALLAGHNDIDLVGETSEYGEIPHLCKQLAPHLLLVSASASSASLVKNLAELRHQDPPIFTLLLANIYNEALLRDFIHAGIVGYITSSDPVNSIVAAIRVVIAGGTWFSQSILHQIFQTKAQSLSYSTVPDPLTGLTERECQVLELMAHGWTNERIGLTLGITERTIRFHIRNIFDKLNFKTRGEAIAWAIRAGLSK